MTVSFYTLGCKVNQYETQVMRESFAACGFTIVDFGMPCDAVIINSCTVTAESDGKTRKTARRAKRENPNALVVIIGCYTDAGLKNPLQKEEKAADLYIGNKEKANIAAIVFSHLKKTASNLKDSYPDIHINPDINVISAGISAFEGRTRAVVKIQDGCDNFCSYCIIPYARGQVKSRPIDDISAEVHTLLQNGYQEIVLTGIHLASYGKEYGYSAALLDVIKECARHDGLLRLRLGSLEPRFLTRENVESMAKIKMLCPHFHVSLQSGCDEVLKRMNRRYTVSEFENGVALLRQSFKDCAITTDIITGFPEETEKEFEITLNFMKKMSFSGAHIFPYSKREGTAAARMEGQVLETEKKRRARLLSNAEKESRNAYITRFLGRVLPVLFESEISKDVYEGLTPHHIPVRVFSGETLSNTELPVFIESCENGICKGRVV